MGLALGTAVHVCKTGFFSPWDVVEFLISAGINSSSSVTCVIPDDQVWVPPGCVRYGTGCAGNTALITPGKGFFW